MIPWRIGVRSDLVDEAESVVADDQVDGEVSGGDNDDLGHGDMEEWVEQKHSSSEPWNGNSKKKN
ncbi:hypothetical protein L484_010800 [Morus notabilis]|uniref:Uncharacterized protein n=1 Tax=Morus notabilis TaxID=981085 RepID=W9SYW6_9ROSA|nr:hypothetical protein L484_010800 [Morus notabilis]